MLVTNNRCQASWTVDNSPAVSSVNASLPVTRLSAPQGNCCQAICLSCTTIRQVIQVFPRFTHRSLSKDPWHFTLIDGLSHLSAGVCCGGRIVCGRLQQLFKGRVLTPLGLHATPFVHGSAAGEGRMPSKEAHLWTQAAEPCGSGEVESGMLVFPCVVHQTPRHCGAICDWLDGPADIVERQVNQCAHLHRTHVFLKSKLANVRRDCCHWSSLLSTLVQRCKLQSETFLLSGSDDTNDLLQACSDAAASWALSQSSLQA